MTSGGDDPNLHWRETFFIFFESGRRPTLAEVEACLGKIQAGYELSRGMTDPQGRFESLAVNSPDDRVTVEISYESGDAIREQASELCDEVKREATAQQIAILRRADARFDIMHFEQIAEEVFDDDEDFEDDLLDPSCLLSVVDALVQLTDGVPIDPASGAVLP